MNHPAPTAARVLVASDDQDDAQQILRQLEGEFERVQTSTDADRAVQDFGHYRPDVILMDAWRCARPRRHPAPARARAR